MPALYRMPVAWLAVAIAAGCWSASGWLRADATPRRPATAAQGRPAAVDLAPEAQPETPASTGQAPLATADGLARKAIVTELGVICRSEPASGWKVGGPLDYFSTHFLLAETAPGATPMLRLGSRDGKALGWVPATSVLAWDTRLMARPTPRAGRPPIVLYRDESCLLDALGGRTCPTHSGHCPTEGEEPAGEEPIPALGLPVLASRSIPQPDGTDRTILEVASPVRDRAPPPAATREVPADMRPALKRIYVAFAVDTTASMKASLDAARSLASSFASTTRDRHGDSTIRLALVEYRDVAQAYGFRTRIVAPFVAPEAFLAALGRVEAAGHGDGSVDESALDGVAVALPPAEGEAIGALRHLDWPTGRSGELATKMLVLLGDAPDHARDLDRARSLAATALSNGIAIAAVNLERPGQLSRDERSRIAAQWGTLASDSFRPLDRAGRPAPPIVLSAADAGRLPSALRLQLDDRVEHARTLAAAAAADAENRLSRYVNGRGLTIEAVAPVLVDLHRGGSPPVARPDPRLNGRRAPSIRRGWVAEREGGSTLAAVEFLMARPDLSALIDELIRLQAACSGVPRDLDDLLKVGASDPDKGSFLSVDRGPTTIAEHLRRRLGLPLPRADSLLLRTQADLLDADDSYRLALNARLAASISALSQIHDAADWSSPTRTVDGLLPVPLSTIFP